MGQVLSAAEKYCGAGEPEIHLGTYLFLQGVELSTRQSDYTNFDKESNNARAPLVGTFSGLKDWGAGEPIAGLDVAFIYSCLVWYIALPRCHPQAFI